MEFLFAQEGPAQGTGIMNFLPIILIVAIFYFLLWRPQSKQRKAHQQQLDNLKKGDAILTRGGIYGKIVNFQGKENTKVTIDLGGNTKIVIARSYIAGLAESAPEKPEGN